MKDSRLCCSLDRTAYLPVAASVFAIVLFSFMLIGGMDPFAPSELPKVNYPFTAPEAADEDAIVLAVHHGKVFWRNHPVSVSELPDKLTHVSRRHRDEPIFLAVDAHTTYGDLAKVLTALQWAQRTKVVFLVEQRKYWTSSIDYTQPRFWNLAYRWDSMDWLLRADFMLLVVMLVNVGAVFSFRFYNYETLRRESRAFTHNIKPALREGYLDAAITLAVRTRQAFLAAVTAETLAAYASAPSHLTHSEALGIAQRAYQRSSSRPAAKARVGLGNLAMIASSATFIGFLGTIYGILTAFHGSSGSKAAALAQVASDIAGAVMLGGVGLFVSLLAVWSLKCLRRRLDLIQGELADTHLEVIESLSAHPTWRERYQGSPNRETFGVLNDFAARIWEVPYDRQRPLALAMWACILFVAYVMANDLYWSWVFHRRGWW